MTLSSSEGKFKFAVLRGFLSRYFITGSPLCKRLPICFIKFNDKFNIFCNWLIYYLDGFLTCLYFCNFQKKRKKCQLRPKLYISLILCKTQTSFTGFSILKSWRKWQFHIPWNWLLARRSCFFFCLSNICVETSFGWVRL